MCERWQSETSRRPSESNEAPSNAPPQKEAAGKESPLPCADDDPWEAFVPDDDHEPEPEPGDFWWEDE